MGPGRTGYRQSDSTRGHTRRSTADNFLALYLGLLSRFRAEIERGLGPSIMPVLLAGLDDFMGPRWEEMFRSHLRRWAAAGRLGPDIVAVGPWWSSDGQVEIDAVALAGRSRTPVLVGEAKWRQHVDGVALTTRLRRRAAQLPGADPDTIRPVICARTEITGAPPDVLTVTAADIMSLEDK